MTDHLNAEREKEGLTSVGPAHMRGMVPNPAGIRPRARGEGEPLGTRIDSGPWTTSTGMTVKPPMIRRIREIGYYSVAERHAEVRRSISGNGG